MIVGIKDVAKKAGVSNATVSRVLAQKPHVRQEVRQRVLDAVAELGYRPSRVARSLRVRSSQIIGLIISDIQNPFFTALVRAVEDRAYAEQHAVFLCNTDEDVQKEALYIDLMISEQVSGVILTPTRETNSPARKLIEAGIPTVTVDRRITDLDLDSVVLDNRKAARDLVSLLTDAGHRRIGAVLGSPEITTGRERLAGYRDALEAAGIPFDPKLVRSGLPKEDSGFRFTGEILDLAPPPTALFTGNNLLSVGALRQIDKRQISVPGELSLVGFDDMEWTTLIEPALTVVSQPTYEIGRQAADLLSRRVAEPTRPIQSIVLEPAIQLRESVRDLHTGQVISIIHPTNTER